MYYGLINSMNRVSTPSLITSNLVLNLDASNSLSYPGSGTTWTDLTANGNNQTLYNGVTYSATNGGQLILDGTNDVITGTISPSITGANPITINVWHKEIASQSGDVVSFVYGNDTGVNFTLMGMYYRNSDSYVRVTCWSGASDYSTSFLKDFGVWHYWSLVYNGTTLLLYRDGVPDSGGARTISISFVNNILRLGSGPNTSSNLSNISLGNVQIYNSALNSIQINQNYNATKSRFL